MEKKDLLAGDVLLFPPHKNDFIAQAIAFLTDGEVNHAALCYPSDGKLMIAESILKDGLVLTPFAEHIEPDYPISICRMKRCSDLNPVLGAAQKYLDEKNAYPNFNLGLLGALLLFKKFAPATWKNKTIYRFALLISYELMREVRNFKHANKHPMSCSQFVAQCFTDAGKEYDLKFERMVIAFRPEVLETKNTLRSDSDRGISPIEMLEQTDAIPMPVFDAISDYPIKAWKEDREMTEKDKMKLTAEFIAIAGGKENTCGMENTDYLVQKNRPTVTTAAFDKAIANIALSLYQLLAGTPAANLTEAIDYLKSSTAKNFFVAPQDMLVNCPASLEHIGNLSY